MPGSKPKLYYFAARGRAELIRLVFVASNESFEDVRYTREQWVQHKKDAPTGVMPYVVTGCSDKGPMVQSGAIARYYAKKAGMMGSNDWEFYLVERAVGQIEDVLQEVYKIAFAPEDKKAQMTMDFQAEKGPNLMTCLVKFLKEGGGGTGFYVGKGVTLADLASICLVDTMAHSMPAFMARFPELTEHKNWVMKANAKLAEWIKNRPETPM